MDSSETARDAVARFEPEAIVHTACSYGRASESPLDLQDTNLRLGSVLLQSALDGNYGRTLFLNTGTVLAPEVNLYALSKFHFSQWGKAVASFHPQRLQFIDVKLQQMYGAGDDRSKFTTHVIESCRLGDPRLPLTLGEQRRDFIHVNDVATAYEKILARHDTFSTADSIDVGSGDAVSMREFVELVARLTHASTFLDFGAVPYRPNEAMLCVADTSRLRSLGWVPHFNLESGLRQTIAASSNETVKK